MLYDLWPNQSRGCVKTLEMKIGNDQILDMANVDEMSRRIQWSKNEFSHSLSPEPMRFTLSDLLISRGFTSVAVPAWLSFGR
jgi:hypothetical protein